PERGGNLGGTDRGGCNGPACKEAQRRILNDKKCREFIEKLLRKLWAARTAQDEAENPSGIGTKLKQQRATASTAEWFADRLKSANIVYSKAQPKELPDAYAHVEGGGGVNTIVLDPKGAGQDRPGQIIHEDFHIDPPNFSDIEAALALGGPRFKT